MIVCAVVLAACVLLGLICRRSLSEMRKKMLGVIAASALIGLAAGVSDSGSPVLTDGNLLQRKPNGEGSYGADLSLYVDGEKEGADYHVDVPEQLLTAREEQVYLDAAVEEITEEFPGENASVNCIRKRVRIRDSYQNGKVDAEWSFDNYRIMDASGNVVAKELSDEGELVRARVLLSCGKTERVTEFYFQVFPEVLGEQERFLQQLERELSEQGKKTGEAFLTLPDAVGEHRLLWEERAAHTPEKMLLFGVVLAGFVPAVVRSREEQARKKRECLLELEYPDMVSKLALLLGSGMTLQGAFRKIAFSYEKKRKVHRVREMPVYDEMVIACREMESGVGEQKAYEHFGERCGGAMYRKFANILTQNLKKGSQGVVALLEQEAENAFEERKRAAKRYGEEAGTKLLFPMMIMLGIVMVILIIPAVFAFQI